jgi:hypothetical protein
VPLGEREGISTSTCDVAAEVAGSAFSGLRVPPLLVLNAGKHNSDGGVLRDNVDGGRRTQQAARGPGVRGAHWQRSYYQYAVFPLW